MHRILRSLAVATLLLTPPLAAEVTWFEAAVTDLVPARLMAPGPAAGLATNAREPVAFSWALPADAALAPSPAPFVAESREFWLRVDGAALASGVRLPTTAAGALVRISPVAGTRSTAPELGALELHNAAGRAFPAGQGVSALASAETLAAAGADFEPGTVAFLLRDELGAGALTLAWSEADAGGTYVIQVLDKASNTTLRLATGRPFYLDGERLVIEASLAMEGRRLGVEQVTGFAVSPAGRAWPLTFRRQPRGSFRAELTLDARGVAAPGLWQVEIQAGGRLGELEVLRNARTAFPCALPTARFSGEVAVGKAAGLSLSLGVSTGAPGRYEARGVVFGTDPASGAVKPLAAAHSAAWLEGGRGALELRVEPSILAASGLIAPYELRQLELRDQGRMGLLEHRARALVVRP